MKSMVLALLFATANPGWAISCEATLDKWSPANFTDPQTYKPGENFKFIVHAVPRPPLLEIILPDEREINLLRYPNLIYELPGLSASVISNDRTTTWSNSGFILRVPPANIVDVKPYDAFTRNWSNEVVIKEPLKFSPQGLLRKSSPEAYNDVNLVGTGPTRERTQVTGIFVKVDQNGNTLPSWLRMQRLRLLSRQYALPIVEIYDSHSIKGDFPKFRVPSNTRELIDASDLE